MTLVLMQPLFAIYYHSHPQSPLLLHTWTEVPTDAPHLELIKRRNRVRGQRLKFAVQSRRSHVCALTNQLESEHRSLPVNFLELEASSSSKQIAGGQCLESSHVRGPD